MLAEVGVANFKPFGSRQVAPLAPITLVYGPNSGGKSSLIQALLLAKQSLEFWRQDGVSLIPRGENIDLGNVQSIVHRHELERSIGLTFAFISRKGCPHYPCGFHDPPSERRLEVGLEFTTMTGVSGEPSKVASLTQMTFRSDSEPALAVGLRRPQSTPEVPVASRTVREPTSTLVAEDEGTIAALAHLLLEIDSKRRRASRGTTLAQAEAAVRGFRFQVRIERGMSEGHLTLLPVGEPLSEWEAHRPVVSAETTKDFLFQDASYTLNDISNQLAARLHKVLHLGPLRSAPSRYYVAHEWGSTVLGTRGENSAATLMQHEATLVPAINLWFERFDIPYALSLSRYDLDLSGALVSLTLTDKGNGVSVGFADVGFGIAQVLPVLLSGLLSDNSILCVEEPEAHLHPGLQAHLGDFLIATACLSRGGGDDAPAGNQWIVETHSEALVRRLQRRIREGAIQPHDVSVLYVRPEGEKGSLIRQLKLDAEGRFETSGPDGFFEGV
ncbi:MAG: AAA family ATPase [Fimbriimonadales bacterium]